MKTIIKFFSELFNKNFSHAEKSAGEIKRNRSGKKQRR